MRPRPRRSFVLLLIAAQLSGPAGLSAQQGKQVATIVEPTVEVTASPDHFDTNSCGNGVDGATGVMNEPGGDQNMTPQSPGITGAPTFNSTSHSATVWGLGWFSDNDQYLTFDSTFTLTWVDGAGSGLVFYNVSATTAAPILYASPINQYQTMTAQAIAGGRPVQVLERDPDGTSRLFQTFESTAILRLSTLTDRNGSTNTYARDVQGRLTRVTDVHGRYFDIAYYPGQNLVQTLSDSGGRSTTYAYDGQGRRIGETGPVGLIGYTYDPQNRMTRISYPNGGVRNYTYDGQGRVLTQDDGNGQNAVSYAYYGSSTVVTDALGRATKYDFIQSQGLKKTSKITDPNGDVTSFVYDQNLNLVAQVDPLGRVTKYSYDARGNVTATVDASGASTRAGYEPVFNKPIQVTDALGHQTNMSYDNAGNLTSVADPLSNVTNMSYDPIGHVTRSVDPLSHATNFSYDGNGALSSVQDPLLNTTQLVNDALSRVTQNTDPTSKITQYQYDQAGDVTQVTDALGHLTKYTYGAGRNSKLLTQVLDANSHPTNFEYDDQGRMTKVTNALGQYKTSQYDAKDNLVQTKNARGQIITYAYDGNDRLTRKTLPEGQINYTYDAAGNVTQIAHYNGSSIQNSYDNLNRLTQQIQMLPNGYSATIGYSYDAAGNRTGMSTPWGSFGYVYDSDNRLTSITNPQNKTFAFFYDAAGRRTGLSYPNGIFTTYVYDNANRVTSIIATRNNDNVIVSSVAYTYDAAGNRTSMTDWDGTHTYGYDDLHRLTSAQHPANTVLPVQNETFSYDSVGNRLADAQIGGYTYDVANRLTSNSSFTYMYDADGNQAQKTDTMNAQTHFAFDSQDEVVGATLSSGERWTYKYDDQGRRVEKSSGSAAGQSTEYIYDGRNILVELDNTNHLIRIFTNGLGIDEPISVQTNNDQEYYYHQDEMRNVRMLTDLNAHAIEIYEYLSYGQPLIRDAQGGGLVVSAVGNTLMFAAREFDPEGAMENNRARYLDFQTGRFISSDPLGMGAAWSDNLYDYAGSNPLKYRDPSGQKPSGPEIDDPNYPNKNDPKYGNYCGPGSFWPLQPIDDLDAACAAHDACYDRLGAKADVKNELRLVKEQAGLLPPNPHVFPNTSPQVCIDRPADIQQCDALLCAGARGATSGSPTKERARYWVKRIFCY